MRFKKYALYKIPGRVGAVPDKVWDSQDIARLRRYLELRADNVMLPVVSNENFPAAFRVASGAFLDDNWLDRIADRYRWKDSGVWVVCSLGEPCWVIVRKERARKARKTR